MMSERTTTDLLMMSQSLVVSLPSFAQVGTGLGGVGSPSHHHRVNQSTLSVRRSPTRGRGLMFFGSIEGVDLCDGWYGRMSHENRGFCVLEFIDSKG